jgi:hypothetical protein
MKTQKSGKNWALSKLFLLLKMNKEIFGLERMPDYQKYLSKKNSFPMKRYIKIP